jgi:flavin reductase (DIM6/NTAB) family NADH-FMN oxidoreductase RutF
MLRAARTFSLIQHVIVRGRNAKGYCTDTGVKIRDQLRALLRETAQSVAVITSLMHPGTCGKDSSIVYHGATLSSFTSIAMDPYPLVTFSLRTPSRMATSLKSAHPRLSSHMVINILSAEQSSAATQFSRPDLYPEPFSSILYFLNSEGLPILEGSLGALSCQMMARTLPLHDLDFLEKRSEVPKEVAPQRRGVGSELFIARVVRVEESQSQGKEMEVGQRKMLPLLYHRQGFTSCETPLHSKLKNS